MSDTLDDLPAHARAQAESQIAAQVKGAAQVPSPVTGQPKTRKVPLRMKAPPVKISEAQRQQGVVTTLRALGYEVLLIGQKRQPIFCSCGRKNWPITTGSTPGAADLMVSHDRWPGCWLAIEMKTPQTRRRAEQVELARRGMNVIVETLAEALDAVAHLERQMGIAPIVAGAKDRQDYRAD